MTDAELLLAFETCTLPRQQWDHRAHVRIAYIYASRNDLAIATDKMRAGVKAYNKATNTPESLHRGYHETITVAFMRLVYVANCHTGPHESSFEFVRSLDFDLCRQNFDGELAELPGRYIRPRVRLLLGFVGKQPAG